MRRILFAASVVASVMLCAGVQAADRSPIGCIYGRASKVDRPLLVAVVKGGYVGTTNDEKLASRKIGEGVKACQVQYGWSQNRRQQAMQYTTGRVLRDDAVYQGQARGLTYEILDMIVAKVPADERAAHAQGQLSAATRTAIDQVLKDAGVPFATLPAADKTQFLTVLRQGVQATLYQQDAEAGFARG